MKKQAYLGEFTIVALNLVKAVTKAAIAGYDIAKLKKENPRYVAGLQKEITDLVARYEKIRADSPREVVDFYDNTLLNIMLQDSDIKSGLKKWQGGLEIKL